MEAARVAGGQIPRTLHRVLVRGYDPGLAAEDWWIRFQRLHPAWELKTWGDPHAQDWELGHLFDSCTSGAQLADLMRLEILWREGGVYVDSDVEPFKPLDSLRNLGCFIGTEDGEHISTGVIGAVPGHPAVRELIDELAKFRELPSDRPANEVTGPGLVTRLFDGRSDVTVLPREMFYPYGPMTGVSYTDVWLTPHVVCAHHWAATWVEPSTGPSLRRRFRIKLGLLKRRLRRQGAVLSRSLRSATESEPQVRETEQQLDRALRALIRPGDWCVLVGEDASNATELASNLVARWGRVTVVDSRSPELPTRGDGWPDPEHVSTLDRSSVADGVLASGAWRTVVLSAASDLAIEPFVADHLGRGAVDYAVVFSPRGMTRTEEVSAQGVLRGYGLTPDARVMDLARLGVDQISRRRVLVFARSGAIQEIATTPA
ncbi:glycosyltransferase [Knoellia subterranea]|uniref:glycosyltransferase family 32 protein n=1 Tax=Knoellia subterranea TaxID=184882 RepID=UPI0009FB9B9C